MEAVPRRRVVGALILQGLLAAAFLAAGGAKLLGVPTLVQLFDQIGAGQWLRIVTGLVEVAGAVALLVPGFPALGFHPHSGIATITVILGGQVAYEETSGTKGIVDTGGVEWMRAAGGVWHTGGAAGTARIKGYQLWIALPPEMESIESEARYLGPQQFQRQGPARVILGRFGEAASQVPAPPTMNYLDVALKKGEKWRYRPPEKHTVAWLALHKGKLATPEIVDTGELVVFEPSNAALEFEALQDAGVVLGSAVKHPHDLFLGNYSVHTSQEALA